MLTITITSKDKIHTVLDADIETKFEERSDGSLEQRTIIHFPRDQVSIRPSFDLGDKKEFTFQKEGENYKIVLVSIRECGTGAGTFYMPEFEAYRI